MLMDLTFRRIKNTPIKNLKTAAAQNIIRHYAYLCAMLEMSFIGALGMDAIERDYSVLKKIIYFPVAVQLQKDKPPRWVRCSYFAPVAYNSEWLKKGAQVYCSGTPDVWATIKDGAPVGYLQCTIKEINAPLTEGSIAARPQKTYGKTPPARPVEMEQITPGKRNKTTPNDVVIDDLPF